MNGNIMTALQKNIVAKKKGDGKFSVDGEIDWSSIDTQIKHEGKQIVLPGEPGNMSYDDAIATLERVKEQENQQFDAKELVRGAPYDAAVATYRAAQAIYGAVTQHSIKTWFGDILPDFVTVDTGSGPDDKIQVPLGMMKLPGFDDSIHLSLHREGCLIQGKVKKKDRARLLDIAILAREILRTQSVYRGKAISLEVEEDGSLGLTTQPTFLTLDKTEADLVYTKEVELAIRTCVLSPLKNTAACRRRKTPLKRGILLEGAWGTGKSLTAKVAAGIAVNNGWTFVNLSRAQGLKEAIRFAKTYQPAMIFAEDIDRCADRSDESVNDLINTMDGMIGKDDEIMTVLTTNHIEKIDKALLRPGRFDAIIHIDPPDAEAVTRLIRLYAGDTLPSDADLSVVSERLAGNVPATVREVVERSKLFSLTEDREEITAADLEASALTMGPHINLLKTDNTEPSPAERFTAAFKEIMGDAITGSSDHKIEEVKSAMAQLGGNLTRRLNSIERLADGAKTAAEIAGVGVGDVGRKVDMVDKKLAA